MRRVLDAFLILLLLPALPVLLLRRWCRGRRDDAWTARLGRGAALPAPTRARLLLHAVSVGEVNAIRLLVAHLLEHPARPDIVVATTTGTGFARARSLFGGTCHVVRYPLDFPFAVDRFLDRVRPDLVALVELEVWPQFSGACARRGIDCVVVNGRLSARSFRWYRRVRPLVRPAFTRLARVLVQSDAYAARFIALGVDPARIETTGTMKWDTAEIADAVPGAVELGAALGIDPSRPLVVAGSTADDEHALLRAAVPPGVQLLCAPRRPEWFDGAAAALAPCIRRSRPLDRPAPPCDRFLLDTIGELRAAYALATLVVIGRSFGSLHGSDMMEPVALGRPVIVGPRVTDFADTVEALERADAIVRTDRAGLADAIRALLSDPVRAHAMAERGRAVIRQHQGATRRTCQVLGDLLRTPAIA